MPVPDMFTCAPWNGPTVVPDPSTKREKGRPRSTRIRNKMDASVMRPRNTCGICEFSGHNKETCPRRDSQRSTRYVIMLSIIKMYICNRNNDDFGPYRSISTYTSGDPSERMCMGEVNFPVGDSSALPGEHEGLAG